MSNLTKQAAASTTPGASVAIAALTGAQLPAGYYQVKCYAGYYGGTPGTSEEVSGGNIEFYDGAVATPLGIAPIVGSMQGPFVFNVQLNGATQISVGSGAQTPTGSVVYAAAIYADKLM